MDALDFLKMFDNNSVDGVVYDPPYSVRQVSECYKSVGIEQHKKPQELIGGLNIKRNCKENSKT